MFTFNWFCPFSKVENGIAYFGCSKQLRCSWANWQHLLELYPQYLSEEQADHLSDAGVSALHCFLASANEAVSQHVFAWLVLPKLHVFHHVCIDVKVERYSPRWYHAYSGEDFMGLLKIICFRCAGNGMALRVLKRSLLRLVSAKQADVDALGSKR